MVEVKVALEYVGQIPIQKAIEEFQMGKMARHETQPLEAVQMLNIILQYAISINPTHYEVIGRRYFQPNCGKGVYVFQFCSFLTLFHIRSTPPRNRFFK